MNMKQSKVNPMTQEELQKFIPKGELNERLNKLLKLNYTTMEKVVNVIQFLNKEVKVFGDDGFSFQQLGVITEINHTYLNRIMNKERENLSVEYIEKFADGLGIDIRSLLC